MLVAFSIAPSGPPQPGVEADAPGSFTKAVATAVAVVRASGLPHHTDAMFTTIEGNWEETMAVVHDAIEAISPYGDRVSLVLKADIRPGHSGELEGKVARIERVLAEREH